MISLDMRDTKPVLTQTRLKELLDYDPETGLFTWLVSRGSRKAGTVTAGSLDHQRYRIIRVDGHNYRAHRLIWLYVHGRWPEAEIDHKDGDPGNNRLANLREATRSENCQNKRKAIGISGFFGVSLCAKYGWLAQIKVNGRNRHLGYFSDPEAAQDAYLKAKAEHHPFQTITD